MISPQKSIAGPYGEKPNVYDGLDKTLKNGKLLVKMTLSHIGKLDNPILLKTGGIMSQN